MPGDTIATLIERIYGSINDVQNHEDRTKYIMERAILTPLNEDVDAINNKITTNVVRQIDGSLITTRKYHSADIILEHDRNSMYPTEYLNKLNLSGIVPPHCLELFVGCPIMLLKNMAGGLANGTRLIVTRIMTGFHSMWSTFLRNCNF